MEPVNDERTLTSRGGITEKFYESTEPPCTNSYTRSRDSCSPRGPMARSSAGIVGCGNEGKLVNCLGFSTVCWGRQKTTECCRTAQGWSEMLTGRCGLFCLLWTGRVHCPE